MSYKTLQLIYFPVNFLHNRRFHYNWAEFMLLFSSELRQEGAKFICDDGGKASGCNGLDLKSFEIEELQEWVLKHDVFRVEYNALRIAISHNEYPEHLRELLKTALFVCQILIQIYEFYLDLPAEAEALKLHENEYRTLLGYPEKPLHWDENAYPSDFVILDKEDDILSILSSYFVRLIKLLVAAAQKVRKYNPLVNFFRLALVRTRRLLDAVRPLLSLIHEYHAFMLIINKVLEPVLNWLSWVFFLPRLISNLYQIIVHAIPGNWMREEEKSLSIWSRILAQLHQVWPELGNDSPWCSLGVAICFFLVAQPVVAVSLTLGLFAYDVVLASVRGYFKLRGLYDLYDEGLNQFKIATKEEKEAMLGSLKALDKMMVIEECRVSLAIINTLGILGGACLLSLSNSTILAGVLVLTGIHLSILANPIIPLVGAALVLTFTVMTFILGRVIDACEPKPTAIAEQLPPKRYSGVETRGMFGRSNSRGRELDFSSQDENRFGYVSGNSPERI